MTDNAVRYVAIGDSFTEGVGDERPDGVPRGWADLVAEGWAASRETPISYANLAIRGKLAWPVVEQQLDAALELRPTHLSFNGGGNDMLRPRTPIAHIVDAFRHVLDRCAEEGVTPIVLSGANPSRNLPMAKLIQRRGDELSSAVSREIASRTGVITVWNWHDPTLAESDFWADDRLHMNARGHHRVAARVLRSLDASAPESWWNLPRDGEARSPQSAFVKDHLVPWVGRRIRGTSSGDNRAAKYPAWVQIG